ncbi:MAG: T9SS type A sorting domain-containing protein [Bacteroidetes bacterium]|nr:T9SS type A sorting domain-containing protein [Bacteroidota bacterium]
MEKYFTNRKYHSMKRKVYLLGCLLTASLAFGQDSQNQPKCGSDAYYQELIKNDPTILQRAAEFEVEYQEYLPVFKAEQHKAPQKFIIPVVFHVYHTGGSENISRAQILNQLDTMNRAYNGIKFEKVRRMFWGIGADCEIEFRLATIDPEGNCTDGIVRVYNPETENATDHIKYKSAWPTDKYFNVWVVKNINISYEGGGTVLGYAQFPWVGGAQTDGVVMRHDYIGSIGTATGNGNDGSTLVHECGHWLGLLHTFQDSCLGGDQVDDTPPVEAPNFGCHIGINSCHNDDPDLPDMIENYMDYTNGNCMGLFTIGQKARMFGSLLNWRKRLWQPSNLVATGTADPYVATRACAPQASFYATTTSVCESGCIQFTNNTYNAVTNGISYQWEFEGGTPATSTDKTPTVTVCYNTPGWYKAKLIAYNNNGSDTFVIEKYIQVINKNSDYGAGLTEGFEFETFPVNDWTTYSTSSVNFERIATGEGSIGGTHACYIYNTGIENGAKFYLESPSVNLSAVSNPVLSFYYAGTQRRVGVNTTADAFEVQASTDCGRTWKRIGIVPAGSLSTTGGAPMISVNFIPSGASQWKKVDMPITGLSSYENVKVRFRYSSNGGHNFFVDNINIGFSTGLADFTQENNFTVYPNPSAGTTNIRVNMPQGQNVTLEVLDMYGRTVKVLHNGVSASGDREFQFIPESNLSNGIYFVRLSANGQSYTRKLMLIQQQ